MKSGKRVTAFLLAISLLVSNIPFSSYANEAGESGSTEGSAQVQTTDPVSQEPAAQEPEETKAQETEAQETEPQETEAQETEAQETEAQETEPQETEAQETEPQETEAEEASAEAYFRVQWENTAYSGRNPDISRDIRVYTADGVEVSNASVSRAEGQYAVSGRNVYRFSTLCREYMESAKMGVKKIPYELELKGFVLDVYYKIPCFVCLEDLNQLQHEFYPFLPASARHNISAYVHLPVIHKSIGSICTVVNRRCLYVECSKGIYKIFWLFLMLACECFCIQILVGKVMYIVSLYNIFSAVKTLDISWSHLLPLPFILIDFIFFRKSFKLAFPLFRYSSKASAMAFDTASASASSPSLTLALSYISTNCSDVNPVDTSPLNVSEFRKS